MTPEELMGRITQIQRSHVNANIWAEENTIAILSELRQAVGGIEITQDDYDNAERAGNQRTLEWYKKHRDYDEWGFKIKRQQFVMEEVVNITRQSILKLLGGKIK